MALGQSKEKAIFPIEHIDPAIDQTLSPDAFFESYRLVDIETHKVFDYQDGQLIDQKTICYECWNHGRPCHNCVSKLAVTEDRQVIKLETLDRHIFLIVAIPFHIDNRSFTLEFIKDATEDLLVSDIETDDNITAIELVDRINELTIRHPSTGLLRKEYAERKLGKLIQEWDGTSPVLLTVFDLDCFKQVNDDHGHLVGDEVITRVSHILVDYAGRAEGWGSRVGGDEFMLVLPNLPEDKARALIEDMKKEIAAQVFDDSDPFSVTASCGIVALAKSHTTWRDFFAEADRAMYDVKHAKHKKHL